MDRGEVLRAVRKSDSTSSLELAAVAAHREWIERCWPPWDRDGDGKISLDDFLAEGGLADLMPQQSALAATRRAVCRIKQEALDSVRLAACCQQLVQAAVGVLPEDPITSGPERAVHKPGGPGLVASGS